jgi:hypothetical protein
VLTIGCPLLGVTSYLLYTSATSDPWLTMVLYTLAGFTVGIVAVVPYVMIALFPPGDQVFRDLLFVQYRLCHLWWTDPGHSGVAAPILIVWRLRIIQLDEMAAPLLFGWRLWKAAPEDFSSALGFGRC